MELIIGKKVEEAGLKNAFVIEVDMMHGDADGYTKECITIPKEKESLVKEAIDTLEAMLHLPWNEAIHAYRSVPGFLIWFGSQYLGHDKNAPWDKRYTYETWNKIGEYSFEWTMDYTHSERYARCEDYSVYFYDENGDKHYVKIKK